MKSGKPVIYWDTCVFIAWLKDEKAKWPPAIWQGIQDVADLLQIGHAILVVSTLVRTEVFLSTLTEDQKKKFAGILRRTNLQEVAPHIRIADRASSIREKHKIKTPDAIHLATAIIMSVDEMHTMDGWHEDGKRDGLLALSGNVAEYRLWITEPYPRSSPPVVNAQPSEPLKGEQEELFTWKEIVAEEMESLSHEQDGTEQASNELEATPAHSVPLQGSDSGRAQGEAAGEKIEPPQEINRGSVSQSVPTEGAVVAENALPEDVPPD